MDHFQTCHFELFSIVFSFKDYLLLDVDNRLFNFFSLRHLNLDTIVAKFIIDTIRKIYIPLMLM